MSTPRSAPSPPLTAAAARRALRRVADPRRARLLAGFFKTGPGEYGEGDKFLGVTVPGQRAIARRLRGLPLDEVRALVRSPYHEERLLALLLLVDSFRRARAEEERLRLLRFYLRNLRYVNNWDLVDLTAGPIVGPYLETAARLAVERLSRSERVWDRRVSVLAHFHAIYNGDGRAFLRFAPRFLRDPEDLIHKAVGWMLREVGKRASERDLRRFLDRYAARMPRTMLRYAIERLPAPDRASYMRA